MTLAPNLKPVQGVKAAQIISKNIQTNMVAQNQAISWEATVDIMKELTDLYRGNDTDDAADAALISKVVDQVQKTSDEKRTSLSEQVDVLSQKVAEAEARCERENNAEYDSRMSELTRRETVLSEEVEVLEQTTSEIEKRVAMYNNEAKSESELMELTESSKSEEVPRMRHAISLYANITGIKFDYTKEGRLAGAIAIPQSEEVHPFSINASKCSSFEIAEQLWGMMEVE